MSAEVKEGGDAGYFSSVPVKASSSRPLINSTESIK